MKDWVEENNSYAATTRTTRRSPPAGRGRLFAHLPHLNERHINAKAVSSVPPRTIGNVLVLCLVAEKNGRKRPMHNRFIWTENN